MTKNRYLRWWIFLTLLIFFCLYWEGRLYVFLCHFVNQIKTCSPYDPLFHLLPAINFYGLLKIGLPVTFILGLIGLFKKFYRLPYLCLVNSLWWLARWTCMISVVFAVPPDRPNGASGFWLVDYLDKVIPNKLISYDQSFMFSGHVGLPFLYCLLFYSNRFPFFSKKWFQENRLSLTLFFWALVQSVLVIFSRAHYTIDVIVAFGMTYTIYSLGRVIFRPIEQLLNNWEKKLK